MAGHDIVVIGASAGGVEATLELIRKLPPDLPAAVFVVIHVPPSSPSLLPRIFDRAGTLRTAPAVDGAPIERGRIYVAPPDHHLLLERGHIRVVRGPKENHHRPAVDPLFRTAARAYGPRVVGVVLTGALDDGTAGLYAIKHRGGVAVVQDPKDALFPSMPASALEYVAVDYCVPLAEMSALLARLVAEPAEEEGVYPVSKDLDYEARIDELDPAALQSSYRPGKLSAFTCPECSGPLWELRDGDLVRFRCRVGHAFTGDTMLSGKTEALEEALWVALNTLEESTQIADRLGAEARERNHLHVAKRFEDKVRNNQRRIELIREVLAQGHAEVPTNTSTDDQEDAETDYPSARRVVPPDAKSSA